MLFRQGVATELLLSTAYSAGRPLTRILPHCVCQGAGLNKRKIIEKAVADEVTSILDSGVDEKKLTDLKKGQPNVIMFVGLQARPPGRCTADGQRPAVSSPGSP